MDYRDFSKDGKLKTEEGVKLRWWMLDEKERPQSISSVVQSIYDNDAARRSQYQTSMRLYGNMNPIGLSGFSLARLPTSTLQQRDRLTYNVIQSAGDTVIAKMSKNKPKAMFLTSGGMYKLQRKAKKLDKFCEGVFHENEAYILGPETLKDSFVFGNGLTYVFAKDGRIKYERVLAPELFVDFEEALQGNPRQLHRIKTYDREVLAEMFPEKHEEIMKAQRVNFSSNVMTNDIADQLNVVESWHLPSGKKAKDGKRVITIFGGDELLCEEWKKPYFPFANLPWNKRQIGYWAQSGAEQIQGIQLEINKILWTIQRSYQLAGSFKVWMKIGSKIVKEHINNEIGAIIESEEAPQYLVPPIVPPEMYSALRDRKQDAFEQVGVSQLSAASQKPAGLDSGKALRTFNDIESDRFQTLGQAYENYFLQLSRLTIDVAREIYAKDKKLSVKTPNSRFIDSIDWKDCALEDDDMILQMFPVSSLPNDPADRMQTIQEWVQAGWITPRTARRLMNFPDIEAVDQLENAKEDYLHMIFEKMIDEGEFISPEPFDDLQLAKTLFLEYYAWAKINGVEEEKLDLLRSFNSQVDTLIQEATPPQPQVQAGQPQANPQMTPQSDLIQNTPTQAAA